MRLYPKKRLGQNFLVDKNIQRKIVEALELAPEDIVLEIGGGRGELTCAIAANVAKICALEIDCALCNILIQALGGQKNAAVLNQDILKFDLKKHFSKAKRKIKVVGNIPYYISSPIIEHLLKYKDKISVIYLTVQKEFAERIVAHPRTKGYGSFSCFTQYYLEPKIILKIKKACFYPEPKVDSCLLRLKVREKPEFLVKDEARLFKLIRAAFNQRRKTLRNSLGRVVPEETLQEYYNRYNIDSRIRPERLSLRDFVNLANT